MARLLVGDWTLDWEKYGANFVQTQPRPHQKSPLTFSFPFQHLHSHSGIEEEEEEGAEEDPSRAHRLNKQITPLLICTKTVISRPIYWHWIQELHSCCWFWFCPRYCCCCELSFPRSRLQWANQGRRWWWRYDVVEHGIDEHEPLGGCRGATEVFDSNHFNIKVYLHWVARDSAPCCCVAPVLRQWFDTRGPYITPSGVCEWERIDWRLSLW